MQSEKVIKTQGSGIGEERLGHQGESYLESDVEKENKDGGL